MEFIEAAEQLQNIIKYRGCTIKEKEALYKMLLIAETKIQEEDAAKTSKECVWHVGDYFFHSLKDALYMVKNNNKYKNSYIIEKRTDEHGNVTSKKYTLVNGEILGVRKI